MKKIILKYKLKNRDTFEDNFENQYSDFSPIYWQHDRIYIPRDYKPSLNYPRFVMRTELRAVDEPPKYFLILRRHIEDSGVDIVEETQVYDYTATTNIILQLGFKLANEVSRRREELELKEGINAYLDQIDGREGSYVKIESILADNNSVEETKNNLSKIIESTGEDDIINKPYFEL